MAASFQASLPQDHTYPTDIEFLDGNYEKVGPVDWEDYVPDDSWDRKFASNGHWAQGFRLDRTHVPTRARLTGPPYRLLDVYNLRGVHLVSERFRHLIKTYEPDVHQFFPIALEGDGEQGDSQYFWFNPCHRVDALPDGRAPSGRIIWRFEDQIVLNQNVIHGMAAFILKRFHRSENLFVSNEIRDAFSEQGLSGVGFYSVAEGCNDVAD